MKKFLFFPLVGLIFFSFVAYNINEDIISFQNIDANQISTWYRNEGSFNRNYLNGNPGFEWPKGSGLFARYASFLWLGTIAGNDTLTAVNQYGNTDWDPGFIDGNGVPHGMNDSAYRIYKIVRGDTISIDYLNWPVDQGAYLNEQGKPFTLGTQTIFFTNHDGYPHHSGSSSVSSLKAQILETVWSYDVNNLLRNVIFMEYRIINRSQRVWTKTYFGIFTDDDVGHPFDDAIGVDTMRDLPYTYNKTNHDQEYGDAPPAVAYKFLRGPYVYTGNPYDTIKYYEPPGSLNLKIKVGFKRTGNSVFGNFYEPVPEPGFPINNNQIYNVLSGLWRFGQSWINPITNQPTKFAYSGDPVTGSGWIYPGEGDMMSMQSGGPFTMNPGDTQSIIIAQVISRGSSNLNSITKLRETADYVQQIYEENFQSVVSIKNISNEIPVKYELHQNYPNPFNPVTHLEFGISKSGFITLKVYDMLGKEVITLVNENKSAGKYVVEFDGSNLPSGIYFYKFTAGEFSETKSMVLLK